MHLKNASSNSVTLLCGRKPNWAVLNRKQHGLMTNNESVFIICVSAFWPVIFELPFIFPDL